MSELIDRIAAILTDDERFRLSKTSVPPVIPVGPTPPGARLLVRGLRHEYATFPATDELKRGVLIQNPGGFFANYRLSDGILDRVLPVSHDKQPRWRRSKPDCFVYRYLNELREFDASSGSFTVIRKFAEYPDINNGVGESDISIDDRHIALYGGNRLFVYDFVSDKIEWSEYLPAGTFDNFQITADNQAVVSLYKPGPTLYRKDGSTLVLATGIGHMDSSSDKAGNPVLVWCNSADDSGLNRKAKLPNCENGVVLIDISSGTQKCLLSLKDNWPAMHISMPDHADFCLVSIYTATKNEILKVGFDGTVKSLVTMPGNVDYERQPRASIGHDGTCYIYNNNGDTWLGTL